MKFYYLLLAGLAMGYFKSENAYSQRISQKELKGFVEKARKKFDVPAMFVAILNNERIIAHELQGVRVVNTDNLVTIDDYFHIGSCAKSMLAVIAGQLIEQNKLRWDTKFFDIFPDLQTEANKEYYAVTLEDLFLCKAGIQPFTSSDEPFPVFDASYGNKRDAFIPWLLKQPPISDKTADNKFQHLYSNAGYTLVAAMLEKVSGKRWEELMKQILTTDLGFSVLFGWPNNYHTSQPWGHGDFLYDTLTKTDKKINKLRGFPPEDPYQLNELIAPAGDLSMKPLDFAKYTQLHLQGLTGVNNYISSETYQYIHFGHQGFSLGVANNSIEGKRISGFDGSGGTFYCRSIMIPGDNFAFTIMINSGSKEAVDWITFKIAKRYYHWWWKFWI